MQKKIKIRAKKIFRRHYLIFIAVCLFAAFIGTEFNDSLYLLRLNKKNVLKDEVINEILKGDINKGKELSKEIINNNKKNNNKIIGYNNGYFAKIVNLYNSGSLYVSIVNTIYSILNSTNISIIILILLSLIISFIFWFFVSNPYKIISRRIFLEGRIYEKVPFQRFIFLVKVKKLLKTSITLFIKNIMYFLWCFTIVGIIIKRYSYFLVPYILAENPNISAKDAIMLSKNMMNNHKFECFKLEFSFILWDILGFITLGISKILFSNPYKIITYCEYYAKLRKEAIENKILNYELLNDKYLFEKASEDEMKKAYQDIYLNTKVEKMELNGVRGFLVRNLGINLYGISKQKEIDDYELKKIKRKMYKNTISKKVYPIRLFSLNYKNKKRLDNTNYLRAYPISSLIIMFFIFSFIGWLWEVSLHLIKNGVFINRGTLHGPLIPIYGWGAILIITLLKRLRYKPIYLFIFSIILCGLIEYFTSFYLETVYQTKWWDYSGYFININGRICAEGLLVFGLGGLATIYVFAPLIDNLLKKFNIKFIIFICIFLITIFIIDQIISFNHPNVGKGISIINTN